MQDDKTSLTVHIDAKTHWLAYYAARENGLTLAEFVESLIREGITRKAMLADEPNVSVPRSPEPLWNEGLWDEDEATRFFLVAVSHTDWLSRSESKLWSEYCSEMTRSKKKINLKTFRQFFASERK